MATSNKAPIGQAIDEDPLDPGSLVESARFRVCHGARDGFGQLDGKPRWLAERDVYGQPSGSTCALHRPVFEFGRARAWREIGDVVLLHSSTRSLGFVVGGTQAIVQALLDVIRPDGTIVVPTHTSDNCDPAGWRNPPVPEAWWPVIREQAPGFDPSRTRAGGWASSPRRSARGLVPCAATTHGSPLPRSAYTRSTSRARTNSTMRWASDIYRLDGKVLLLGCGHDSNTSLHLAEWRQKSPPRGVTGSSIRQPDGTSQWTTWTDVMAREDDFEQLGAAFEATVGLSIGQVGSATARLMSQRAVVDFATAWMAAHRPVM